MNVKVILYILAIPLIMWILESFNIERFFKSNRKNQIIAFYLVLSLGLSYLLVNFIYDFYEVSKIFS